MTDSYPGLRRIVVHAGPVSLDLHLPTGLAVAALIPPIVDLLEPSGGSGPYRLHRVGLPALDGAKTLVEHGIGDGTVLVLTRTAATLPAPVFDDDAERLAATVRATVTPWTPTASRPAAALAGVALAGVAGFVAVPGGPGAPNVLLAAAAAAAVAVLSGQAGGAGPPVLTAVCGLAVLAAAGALALVLTGLSLSSVGALLATAAFGLLQAAPRLALLGSGCRAASRLSGLVATAAAAAALGAATAAGGRHPGGIWFAATAATALLCRARAHLDRTPIATLLAAGIGTLGSVVIAAAAAVPQHRPAVAAVAAALAAAALGAGALRTPALRRGTELLEYAALIALLPLACWCCGAFAAVRGAALG